MRAISNLVAAVVLVAVAAAGTLVAYRLLSGALSGGHDTPLVDASLAVSPPVREAKWTLVHMEVRVTCSGPGCTDTYAYVTAARCYDRYSGSKYDLNLTFHTGTYLSGGLAIIPVDAYQSPGLNCTDVTVDVSVEGPWGSKLYTLSGEVS